MSDNNNSKRSPFAGLDTALVRPSRQRAPSPRARRAESGALIKATFYLEEGQVLALERLRLARRERGEKIDKSALVREAITRLVAETEGMRIED